MKDMTIFKNDELGQVRVVMVDGEPWWFAKDVADILGYSDSQAMTRRIDQDDISTCTDNSSGQVRHIKIISESGLYASILNSRKPRAVKFKKWLTSEVLLSIRDTGAYTIQTPQQKIEGALVLAIALLEENDGHMNKPESRAVIYD